MIYDLAIIGAGPAGLSASVYASRYGIKNVVIGGIAGGLTTQTHEIGNWLASEKIKGYEFANNAAKHASSYGTEIIPALVDEIKPARNASSASNASRSDADWQSDAGGKAGESFNLLLSDGKKIEAKTIILAMGTKHRHLGVPGEKELAGKGVSYCATCDGFFYKGKTVAIVGGNDSAAGAAVFLGDIAEKVYMIYRGDKLRCESFWGDAINKNPKITMLFNTNIKEIKGLEKVESVILDNPFQNHDELKVDGIFAEIGSEPLTELTKELGIETDEDGYIRIDPSGRTSEKGIWAAGDITTGSDKFKQIVTAASEGAIAAHSVQKFLKK
ncbi:MAG: Thioredoxin reductase [Candidatus Moranbacteria bacterium GW2011_GWC2_37_8]|nr:MAG: Thioredoxin reductase [Candidatus Moranbacteria bacterium GW2011_GWC2_37_8]KKQ63359.1 MAG: Thioredoxin reductase [Parcubacteria group bacterium GW2011_GWC1_38_22]